MENRRVHHFAEGTVITGLLPTGEFGAYRDQDDGLVRGHGHTRMAAIADLVEMIGSDDDGSDLAADRQAWAFDHKRTLRNEEKV